MAHPFSRDTKAPKKHVLYNRWNNIKQCINNPNHLNYHYYGGKGIKMCNEWANNFVVFLLWATQNGYHKDLVLTRIDKNKDFCPSNCIWAENNKSIEPFKL